MNIRCLIISIEALMLLLLTVSAGPACLGIGEGDKDDSQQDQTSDQDTSSDESADIPEFPPDTSNADIETGRVISFPFNAGARDESPNGLGYATVTGAILAKDRYEMDSSAYSFDGVDDSIAIRSNSLFSLSDSLTIAVWVHPTIKKTQSILRRGKLPRSVYSLGLSSSDEVVFAISIDEQPRILKIAATMLNAWTFVAATYDGTAMKLYINGEKKAELAIEGTIDPGDGDMIIGTRLSVAADTFKGRIDDLYLYGRALSYGDVYALFLSETADRVPPETTITNGPPATTNLYVANLSFQSTEVGSTFVCTLDRNPFEPCSGMLMIENLTLGRHTFTVAAVDSDGNQDPTPASKTWTIEIDPPETTIETSPQELAQTLSATFSYRSSEVGSSFECSLDEGSFSGCPTSGKTYADLEPGSHDFSVRAIDPAGNTDTTPATYQWFVDVLAPEPSFIEVRSCNQSKTSVTVRMEGQDNIGVTAYCLKQQRLRPTDSDSCWQSVTANGAFESTVSHELDPAIETSILYLWLRDRVGNISDYITGYLTCD